jgi:hypothetical protein
MCDCYEHKCKKCNVMVPMHLVDFNTDQSEIEIYCPKHIPKDRSEGTLWLVNDVDSDYPTKFKGKKIFVKSLTKNAKENCEGNHPNVYDPVMVEAFGKKVKKED